MQPTTSIEGRRPTSALEYYKDRPDIFDLSPKEYKGDKEWGKIKKAHLELLAMLIETYPNKEFYFLARDSELLYDQARLLFKDDEAMLARFHLINVSRANMTSQDLPFYLKDMGLSPDTLRAGKEVLLVDTGFMGTISKVIGFHFPEDLKKKLETHLICSANDYHPSSRSFLSWINPDAYKMHPEFMHDDIVNYEHIERYSYRSHGFAITRNGWDAVSYDSLVDTSEDGNVSREMAQTYREDLIHFSGLEETRAFFSDRRGIWKKLRELGLKAAQDDSELLAYLRELVQSENKHYKAIAVDFLDSAAKNYIFEHPITIDLRAIGINLIENADFTLPNGNKNIILKKHPEWGEILSNPKEEIEKILISGDEVTLEAIIPQLRDRDFNRELAKLVGAEDNPRHRNLIKLMIEQGGDYLDALARFTFSQETSLSMRDLLEDLINKASLAEDDITFQNLAIHVFSQPFSTAWADLLTKSLIATSAFEESEFIVDLSEFAFLNDHSSYFMDQILQSIKLAVADGDEMFFQVFIEFSFFKPHLFENPLLQQELFSSVIALEDELALTYLKEFAPTPVLSDQYSGYLNLIGRFKSHKNWNLLKEDFKRLNESSSCSQLMKEYFTLLAQ